jgi:nucleotide-binding universal stress UspA family protein
MKTIIVPTDFSPIAVNAMNYATEMAKETGASIVLFNAYQIPVGVADVPVMLVNADELKKNAEDRLDLLKQSVEHITSNTVKVYTEAVMGDTVDELETLCNKLKPFAVVMGSKGSSGLERVIFGSTTLTAIRHLSWPVIAVPAGKLYKHIAKVGFACDFKQVVQSTPVGFIKEIVKTFNAELLILNVDYKDKNFKPDTPEQSLLLHTLLEDLNPSYHFIEDSDIENGINDFAEKNNLDLLITIPKKHKLLDAIFHKSSTRQLLFESHIPVMCIHEP